MEPVSERNNFIYLLVSLVVLLLVGALLDQFESALGHHLFQALTVITLASAIIGFRSSRLRFTTGIGFVLSTLVIVVLSVLLDLAGLNYLHLLILIVFYAWVTWLAAKQVLFRGAVDANKIVGAICIYLLMGLVWALMYLLIAQLVPGAFNGLEQIVWYENFANAAYYSFVTLTTLGYGDITPVAPVARFLVYMEAVFGVFYMAILVASLVGIGISTMNTNDE